MNFCNPPTKATLVSDSGILFPNRGGQFPNQGFLQFPNRGALISESGICSFRMGVSESVFFWLPIGDFLVSEAGILVSESGLVCKHPPVVSTDEIYENDSCNDLFWHSLVQGWPKQVYFMPRRNSQLRTRPTLRGLHKNDF